jgi:hypothetical protein
LADDIEKTRRAEVRRGRRPTDADLIDRRNRQKAELREIVDHGTIDDLKDAMREYGLSPDSPQWAEVLRIWNDVNE